MKPADKEAAARGRELGHLLDRIDRARSELAELVKERKGTIAKWEKRVGQLRDLLAGRELAQDELPGTAGPDEAADALADARAARDRRGEP